MMAILTRIKRFLKYLRNQFRFKEGPGEPIVFVSGSEEELRRVSRWISYAYPSLFRYKRMVNIRYFAVWGNQSDLAFSDFPRTDQTEVDYLRKVSRFVIAYNRFTGSLWVREEPNSMGRTTEQRARINVITRLPPVQQMPSEQEQQEAIALLSEWLEERVSPEEKQEILAFLPSYEQALRDLHAWKERFPDRDDT